jgi:hypothetical protein
MIDDDAVWVKAALTWHHGLQYTPILLTGICDLLRLHLDHWACEVSVSHLLEHGALGLRKCGSLIKMDGTHHHSDASCDVKNAKGRSTCNRNAVMRLGSVCSAELFNAEMATFGYSCSS